MIRMDREHRVKKSMRGIFRSNFVAQKWHRQRPNNSAKIEKRKISYGRSSVNDVIPIPIPR